jgi:iron complex outermembrane recepter protein
MYRFILILAFSFSILSTSAVIASNENKKEEIKTGRIVLETVTIKANKIETKDREATFASEVYNHEQIIESGAKTIYDFLGQNTSATVVPSFGNPFSQTIDLRGYGFSEGTRSMVITVDGRRLNTIDGGLPDLSIIPLENIESIEITKGSGSVVYGDSAMAGAIHIYTRNTTATSISGSKGNFGITTRSITTGYSTDKFKFSVLGDTYKQNGFSNTGPDNKRDNAERTTYKLKLQYSPTSSYKFFIEKETTEEESRFVGSLTKAQFESNPGSNSNVFTGNPANFNLALSRSDRIGLGGTTKLGNDYEATLIYGHENKFGSIFNHLRYKTSTFDANLKFKKGPIKLVTGIQTWTGSRKCDTCTANGTAKKENRGIFLQGYYDLDETVLSVGARKEWVGSTFNAIDDDDDFESFDIGLNKAFGNHLNVFTNFNYAFQTTNLDYLFTFNGAFNGFIEPAKSKTLNFGLNHTTSTNKASITLFGSKISNEIFANPITFANTNIDKSTKYGFELHNKHTFSNALSATVTYGYTRAVIDEENSNLNCIDSCKGNDLPGVSAHNLKFGLHYAPIQNSKLILTQIYRSKTFAFDDFSNSFTQKQKAYYTTDIAFHYTFKDRAGNNRWRKEGFSLQQIDIFAKVENLFERSHGIWKQDNQVTPYNFTRNLRLGAEIRF